MTGPVTVPAYGVTIASGETTLKALQNTRVATDPATNRKAFLSAFADQLFGSLLSLPPGCSFAPRCPHAFAPCWEEPPPLEARTAPGHSDRCYLPVAEKRALRETTIHPELSA